MKAEYMYFNKGLLYYFIERYTVYFKSCTAPKKILLRKPIHVKHPDTSSKNIEDQNVAARLATHFIGKTITCEMTKTEGS